MKYRGYEIEETKYETEVSVGGRPEVRPVYVIPGLKERLADPILTTFDEAREYIDAELSAREDRRAERTVTWEASVRRRGNGLAVAVPARIARELGIEEGDEVAVTVEKVRRDRDA